MQLALIMERIGTPKTHVLKAWRTANPMLFDEIIAKLPIVKGSGLANDMETILAVPLMDRREAIEAREEIRVMLDIS